MLALIGHYSWSWLGKEGRCSHGPWLPVMDRARQFSSIPWPLMHKDKRLWKLPDGRDWLWGKLGLALMGGATLSKSLIQFSSDPSLLFDLRPNYGRGNETMVTSFIRSHAGTATISAPDPTTGHHQPTPPPETPGHSQASLGQSLLGTLLLSPGPWCAQGSVCALQESVSPMLWKFCN